MEEEAGAGWRWAKEGGVDIGTYVIVSTAKLNILTIQKKGGL